MPVIPQIVSERKVLKDNSENVRLLQIRTALPFSDIILTVLWKLDRFARNRYDSARYKSLLKKNGVKVVSATEVISDGAEGIILESVLEGYAEYYSADLSEKVIRGMTDNALKCKYNGRTLPLGYVIDDEQHFQIDPRTAPFIVEVYKRYDESSTMTQIRD